jgi:copper chaperone
VTDRHQEERKELIMQVDGMTGECCADAVTKTIRRLDPSAEVAVDLDHGRVTVRTFAQSLEVAEALGKAGYEAKGMTL